MYSSMARASGRRFDRAFLLYQLTDLLTRLVGTWEVARDADDIRCAKRQVSETHRDAGMTVVTRTVTNAVAGQPSATSAGRLRRSPLRYEASVEAVLEPGVLGLTVAVRDAVSRLGRYFAHS